MFLVKLNSSGNYVIGQSFGSNGKVNPYDIHVLKSGEIHVVGKYWGVSDFDPSVNVFDLTPPDNITDAIFTLKLSQCNNATTNTLNVTSCDSYMLNGITYTASGSYNQSFMGTGGCDSNLILNLTINPINVGVTQTGNLLSANTAGLNYQWVLCPSFTPIIGATSQTYTPVSNGVYAVIASLNGCRDTSICYNVHGLGMEEVGISSMEISPNPSSDFVKVTINETLHNPQIILRDLHGKIILTKNDINSNCITLQIGNISNGIYFLEFTNRSKRAYFKLIKQ